MIPDFFCPYLNGSNLLITSPYEFSTDRCYISRTIDNLAVAAVGVGQETSAFFLACTSITRLVI